jgi:fructuronate reductase/mannitol 2-dehydrogenase
LAGRGSTKVPSYLLPSIHEALRRGRPTALLTLALAGWFRCLQGTDLDGGPLEVKDARAEELQAIARNHPGDPRPLLTKRDIFGDLAQHRGFVDQLRAALRRLEAGRVHGLLASHVPTAERSAA